MKCMVVVDLLQTLKRLEIVLSSFSFKFLTYHHSELLYFFEDNALSRAAINAFTSSTTSSSSSQLCAGMTGKIYKHVCVRDDLPVL